VDLDLTPFHCHHILIKFIFDKEYKFDKRDLERENRLRGTSAFFKQLTVGMFVYMYTLYIMHINVYMYMKMYMHIY
jgi:hypothetical protein